MPQNRRRFNRPGFTMIDAIVLTTLLALIAVVALPILLVNDEASRISRTATTLQQVGFAIDSANTSGFRKKVGIGPSALSQLTNPITQTMRTCTGTTFFSGGNVGNWTNNGPFFPVPIIAGNGLPLPIGIASDALTRISTTSLHVTIPNVTLEDATALDQTIDAGNGSATENVKWGAVAADGTVTLTYNIVTGGC